MGAAAIALAASMAIQNAVWSGLERPDTGTRSGRCSPSTRSTGAGRDRGRPGGAEPAAAAGVRDRSARAGRASRGCGRRLVAPRGGRGRDSRGGLRALRRSVGRSRVVRRRARRAEPAVQARLQLHAGAFALALSALGTTFIGAALAAHASRLTPPWQRLLGVAGGSLAIAAGVANLAIADGSALLFVGVPATSPGSCGCW